MYKKLFITNRHIFGFAINNVLNINIILNILNTNINSKSNITQIKKLNIKLMWLYTKEEN